MLFLGPRSSVKGGAAGDPANARARPGADRLALRALPGAIALAGAGACLPAVASSAGAQAPMAPPLWLFWLVTATLLGLGAALVAQTVRMRRSLKRERLANRLIDNSPHLVCVLDPQGAVRHMNGTGRQWLRITHPQLADGLIR